MASQVTSKRLCASVSSGPDQVLLADKTGDIYELPIPTLALDEESGSLLMVTLFYICMFSLLCYLLHIFRPSH